MSLYRLGNMPISMLWSVLVLSRGTDSWTIDGRTKDVCSKSFISLNCLPTMVNFNLRSFVEVFWTSLNKTKYRLLGISLLG